METRISDVLLGYYKRNKKKLLREAIESDNVQLSNSLINLYESLGENLDDIFTDDEIVKAVAEKANDKEETNLSEIFAKKLRKVKKKNVVMMCFFFGLIGFEKKLFIFKYILYRCEYYSCKKIICFIKRKVVIQLWISRQS